MTTDDRTLSNVVPLLVAALVCDAAVTDPSTQKMSLIGIFNRVRAGDFPTSRPVSLYFKLTDAGGHYDIEIRYVQVNTSKILATAKSEFLVKDRLTSLATVLAFPSLKIPDAGRYEFQIWANAMFLGSASMEAVKAEGS